MAKQISIIIISGLSGSGKSTALRTLEDLGFYCVDNLPVLLLPKFIELCRRSSDEISRAALVMDVRERAFLKQYGPTIEKMRNDACRIELLFLECSDQLLLQRFSETRRHHPLRDDGSVLESIRRERDLLKEIKAHADRILDTSDLNVHQLRKTIEDFFARVSRRDMTITFMSFGFKYGIPHEADMVFDARFLPNPYFIRELKELSGTDPKVSQYVLSRPEAAMFLEKIRDLLSFQIPLFEREGKSYLTVAIGCTGGKHRSVTIAHYLMEHFVQGRPRVYVQDRDLEK